MPIIFLVFLGQCYLLYKISGGHSFGDYVLALGAGLALFVGALTYYDTHHHILLYPTKLRIVFQISGLDTSINYLDIKEMIVGDAEASFSSLTIQTKDDKKFVLHFIDHPEQVKKYILTLKDQSQSTNEEDLDLAA